MFRASMSLETADKLQSVGYKNIAMNEKHITAAGDILLFVRYFFLPQTIRRRKFRDTDIANHEGIR